jgi:hypothetical protein
MVLKANCPYIVRGKYIYGIQVTELPSRGGIAPDP